MTSMHDAEPGTRNSASVPGSDLSNERPHVSDDDLIQTATRLYREQGRIPRVVDIVQASGGVRRARANAARQQIAKLAASEASQRWVNVSYDFEQTVRTLLGEFTLAARREVEEQLTERLTASDEAVIDARNDLRDLRQRLKQTETAHQELLKTVESKSAEINALKAALDRSKRDARRYRTQAKERQATIALLQESISRQVADAQAA